MPEQQNIEYKQSWHDDYLKWVCGFANAIGGVIYIGKDNQGNVVHLSDYARLMEDIPNKIRNTMGIICDVELLDEEGKKLISIKVNPYTQALREMLLNALVHRSYMGATIQMRVFDNRLSIWNEGVLPIGLSLEDLKSDHNSRPRNPLIANACFFAGYIDTWGRGTLKIINACKDAGLPEPVIKEMNGGVEVTIYAQAVDDESGGQVGGVIGGQIDKFLAEFGTIASRIDVDSEINKEILMKNSELFTEEIRKKYGITPKMIQDKFGKASGKLQESRCKIGF